MCECVYNKHAKLSGGFHQRNIIHSIQLQLLNKYLCSITHYPLYWSTLPVLYRAFCWHLVSVVVLIELAVAFLESLCSHQTLSTCTVSVIHCTYMYMYNGLLNANTKACTLYIHVYSPRFSFCTHNASLEGATKLKFVPLFSS